MKMENMSVGAVVLWGKLAAGILWILTGVTGMFSGKIIESVHMVLLFSVLLIVGILIKGRCREFDEMFEYNFLKANATTNRAMHYVFCICIVLCALIFGLFTKYSIDVDYVRTIPNLFMLIMGIQDIITALVFKKLEAE